MNPLHQVEVLSIRTITGIGTLRAWADIRIAGAIVITRCSVMEGKRGHYVNMPRQLSRNGHWRDAVIVADMDLRKIYEDAILKAFNAEVSHA